MLGVGGIHEAEAAEGPDGLAAAVLLECVRCTLDDGRGVANTAGWSGRGGHRLGGAVASIVQPPSGHAAGAERCPRVWWDDGCD